ncbi:unnamed protein product [Closterium sp. Yama58-4]|nr:unnamed protein product [Closterium sp. Yama58-4]
MYEVTATGLAPEIAYFNMREDSQEFMGTRRDAEYGRDIQIHQADRHNLLRPETVEALLYMHRVTGNPRYRDAGWRMFQAFEKHTRVPSGGYTSLDDVSRVPPPKRNKMETFLLGETLKYFYLLFGDNDVLPFDKYVFNTEAHPLPIPRFLGSTERRRVSQ